MKPLLFCLVAAFSFCVSEAWGQDRGAGRSVVRPDIAPRPPRVDYPWSRPATQPIFRPAVQSQFNTVVQSRVNTIVQPRTYVRNELRNHHPDWGFCHSEHHRWCHWDRNYCGTTTSNIYTPPLFDRPCYLGSSFYGAQVEQQPAIVVIQKPEPRPVIITPPPVIYEKAPVEETAEEKEDADYHVRVKVKTYRGKIKSLDIERDPDSPDGKVVLRVKVHYQ